MRQEVPTTKVQYVCDGCDYLMSNPAAVPCIEVVVPWDGNDISDEPSLEDDERLTFHFHVTRGRDSHDCFRYWAHTPRVMKRSLERRGLNDDAVDEFMRVMLYRGEPGTAWPGPGVEREKKPAATA